MVVFELRELQEIESQVLDFMQQGDSYFQYGDNMPTQAERDRLMLEVENFARQKCMERGISDNLQFRFTMLHKKINLELSFKWVVL